MMKSIIDALRSKTSTPPPPPQLPGSPGEAQTTLAVGDKYRAYAETMIEAGKRPVSQAEFAKGLR